MKEHATEVVPQETEPTLKKTFNHYKELRGDLLYREEHPQWFMYNKGVYFVVFEKGDWSDEGKYQYASAVYLVKPEDEEPYMMKVDITRSGSYYSEYYYHINGVSMVTAEKKIITQEVIVYTEVNVNA